MSDFQLACKKDDVPSGAMRLVEIADRLVLIVNVSDEFYCIDDVCTHDGGTLSDGVLHGCEVACPRHGAKFDVRSGKALTMPATEATVTHEVKLDGDSVYVRIE